MKLLTPKSTLETDLAEKDALVRQCAEAVNHLAAVMSNAHAWLWSLPTDRLLALLNADVSVTLATFSQNTALGLAANAALGALSLPEFPTRAPVEPGRADIVFDGTQFALVEQQPDPQSAPDPESPV